MSPRDRLRLLLLIGAVAVAIMVGHACTRSSHTGGSASSTATSPASVTSSPPLECATDPEWMVCPDAQDATFWAAVKASGLPSELQTGRSRVGRQNYVQLDAAW